MAPSQLQSDMSYKKCTPEYVQVSHLRIQSCIYKSDEKQKKGLIGSTVPVNGIAAPTRA